MITCYDCQGQGIQVFLGNESKCKPCGGNGKMIVCNSFALAPNAVVAFRNQKCHNCGVRQNDHKVSEVKA